MTLAEIIVLITTALSSISALILGIANFINNRGKAPAEVKQTQADTATKITEGAGALILLLQGQILDMREQIKSMQKEISVLKTTVDEYHDKLEAKDDEVKTLMIRIKLLQESIDDKNLRIATLEKKIAELKNIQKRLNNA